MTTLLILLVVVLVGLIIARITRIVEISNELSGEDDSAINDSDNKFNARMLLFILVATIAYFSFVTFRYQRFLLPESASEHGVSTDAMLWLTFGIIIFVFFVTQILLFWYGYKYRFDKNRTALFYPDNHKVELIWTAVPAAVLIALVSYGLVVWNKMTDEPSKDALVIELYAKQFDWTARYGGKDNNLGTSNFRYISGTNALGLDYGDPNGKDDVIARELHLPVNREVLLVFHSRDVIHSAYLPHFRTQMNCVPGMTTRFKLKPTITTAEMKEKTKNPDFHYILLCNKICGVAHYNMKLEIVCDTETEFNEWMSKQKTVAQMNGEKTEAPGLAANQ